MKNIAIGLALVALALGWVGYRMDIELAGPARIGCWVAAAGFVTTTVLTLLRRV